MHIIIVGAGIAGLSAAVALRQGGHRVEIFEKSAFAAEIGAALALAPNGVHVLNSLNFSLRRARATRLLLWQVTHGSNLEPISVIDFNDAEERFGAPLMAVHRVDLHKELLRLALDENESNRPAALHLGMPIVKVSPEEGWVETKDGQRHQADLVVAADGVHSVIRRAALGRENDARYSGKSAFRFLADTKTLREDEGIRRLIDEWKPPGATIFADTANPDVERHMVWYDCQGGEVQNFVGIHEPARQDAIASADDQRGRMIQEFSHYHPDLVRIIRLANEIKCWPIFSHEPLSQWSYGKVLLIGDSAHAMLPFGGQGSNQALEDAGALGYLLRGVDDASKMQQRLKFFEEVRINRASRTQTMSKVSVGNELKVFDQVKKFANDNQNVPVSFSDRIEHDFGYNVLKDCERVLQTNNR